MGTSKSYGGIKGNPKWSTLSADITSACNVDGNLPEISLAKICSRMVNMMGGSNNVAFGRSRIAGRSGGRVSQKLGSVISSISTHGLSGTLSQLGYDIGPKVTADDAIDFILEYTAGTAVNQDDVAAKCAERDLLQEICVGAKTLEDLETNFKDIIDKYGTEYLLIRFDAYYLYEHFAIDFNEKLLKEKGPEKCANIYRQLKYYLTKKVENLSKHRNLTKIDWNSIEGQNLSNSILEETLKAFEGYEG
jgi:hypothetical protein